MEEETVCLLQLLYLIFCLIYIDVLLLLFVTYLTINPEKIVFYSSEAYLTFFSSFCQFNPIEIFFSIEQELFPRLPKS